VAAALRAGYTLSHRAGHVGFETRVSGHVQGGFAMARTWVERNPCLPLGRPSNDHEDVAHLTELLRITPTHLRDARLAYPRLFLSVTLRPGISSERHTSLPLAIGVHASLVRARRSLNKRLHSRRELTPQIRRHLVRNGSCACDGVSRVALTRDHLELSKWPSLPKFNHSIGFDQSDRREQGPGPPIRLDNPIED
jgi:hypothetical protein